jgi:hypothetical protein
VLRISALWQDKKLYAAIGHLELHRMAADLPLFGVAAMVALLLHSSQ